jgi:hypothetical protein
MEYSINLVLSFLFGLFLKVYDDIIDNKLNISEYYRYLSLFSLKMKIKNYYLLIFIIKNRYLVNILLVFF